MFPICTPMKPKPSRWRVSAYGTISVKHHRKYVNMSNVESLKASIKLSRLDSNGMYQRVKMIVISAVKFIEATCTHTYALAKMRIERRTSLLAIKRKGTRIRNHFVLLVP